MLKKTLLIILIIILGGLSGIIADRYLFPYLSSTDFFNKYKFLKKGAEGITVINKTEQVYVKEDTSVTKIAGQVSSSVVNIVSYPDPQLISPKNPSEATKNSTGLIVTSDGIIMSYSTVDADSAKTKKYKVMTFDGNAYDAQFLTIDSYSNLIFFKINASNLPAVSFGNSDDFQSGEKIIAIGNSLEKYQNIYSSGILNQFDSYYNLGGKTVSSSEKLEGVFRSEIVGEESYVGGPIIDYSGQVIGITGLIEQNGKTDFFQIPGNKVKLVLDKVIKKETDKNYKLGIYYVPITKSFALANNLSIDKGVMVFSPSGQQGLAIIAQSPAEKAGIKIRDIITQVNGEDITPEHNLTDLLYKYQSNDTVSLTIIRNGNQMEVKVTI